ncbi:Serralysin B precursor [Ruegeria atlantica]|uniref:Serralysin B n=1 Tax=Ruegeria atlantica TaxID=81569 RepID=A0A0N7LPA1_9RHOB|nr:Serralysin B precursor [Ruegeria atlantica]
MCSSFGTLIGTAGRDVLNGNILPTTLVGGAGDDILIAGSAETTMNGGSGADIFVMQYGAETTMITDFQAGIDRLDMFDYPLLRMPGKLTFTVTAQGARIEYHNETINVSSATGGPLTSAQVFGAGFGGPDHIPVDFGVFGGSIRAVPMGFRGMSQSIQRPPTPASVTLKSASRQMAEPQ